MKAIIVAYSDNRVIGSRGDIPWMGKMPADMDFMRQKTKGAALIMGRATFESIGRPLPERQNIVLTRDATFKPNGVDAVASLDQAFAAVDPERENTFIFGGAKVYVESLDRAAEFDIGTVFATEIHAEFEGDAFFPILDPRKWREISRRDYPSDTGNHYPYSFVQYDYIKEEES